MKTLAHPRWWIFLAVMALALLAVDRVAARVAAGRVAMVIQEERRLAAEPEVSFSGVPFLTQVLGGNIGELKITAVGVANKTQTIRADRVNSTITNIQTSVSDALALARDPHNAADDQWPVAERVDVTATLSYASLAKQVNAKIGQPDLFEVRFFRGSGPNRLGFETRLKTMLGDVPTRGEAKVSLGSNSVRIQIDPETVTGLTGLTMKALKFAVDQELPVAQEYPGVDPTDMRMDNTQLVVTAAGDDVVLKTQS